MILPSCKPEISFLLHVLTRPRTSMRPTWPPLPRPHRQRPRLSDIGGRVVRRRNTAALTPLLFRLLSEWSTARTTRARPLRRVPQAFTLPVPAEPWTTWRSIINLPWTTSGEPVSRASTATRLPINRLSMTGLGWIQQTARRPCRAIRMARRCVWYRCILATTVPKASTLLAAAIHGPHRYGIPSPIHIAQSYPR
jgi:hypothetical protein